MGKGSTNGHAKPKANGAKRKAVACEPIPLTEDSAALPGRPQAFEGLPTPYYRTRLGEAHLGDSRELLKGVPDSAVSLVVTSPPFALVYKKAYGNESASRYVEWFLDFAREFHRVLADDGSLVIDIGGAWNPGVPTRSLYQAKLLLALCEDVGFHLAQDFYWHNPAALPAPAEWVNVRRLRVKTSVNQVWWLSKTEWPKANNRNVLQSYSQDMERLIKRGYRATLRPSGHNITDKFGRDNGGSIPSNFIRDVLEADNLLEMGNNDANSAYLESCRAKGLPIHPARFPRALPEFFTKLCTDEGDLVVDPFAGSNMTGSVAEALERRWLGFELDQEYLEGSRFRFQEDSPRLWET